MCTLGLLIGMAVPTPSLGAQEARAADSAAHPSSPVVKVVDRFVEAFNRGDSTALGAAFSPRSKVFEFYLGEDRLAEAEWLDVPWRYHAIHVPPGSTGELRVLQRLVSGSFVTQRERLSWTGPDGRTGTMIRMATYQVRGDRIHRLWLLPDEPDPARVPAVPAPTYPAGNGPTVWVDAWHWNTGTPDITLWSFAELLRRDGYPVRAWQAPFTRAALDSAGILVIVNAQPEPQDDARRPLPLPPAFTRHEVDAVRSWVADGGSLLLVADHEPFAGAAAQLAAVFGAEFHDGAAVDTTRRGGGGDVFRRADGTLRPHPVTDGRSPAERVDSVATFRGQAFRGSEAIAPILVLPDAMVLSVPDSVPPNPDQPRHIRPVGGWLQAGARPFGDGRVAIFGEAWMFRFFNDPSGRGPQTQNAQLILNLMRWLSAGAPRGLAALGPEGGLDLLARAGVDVARAVDADGGLRSNDRCDRLGAAVSVRAVLDPGGSHCYELHLERGDYALVVVRELGGDLVVEVTRPGETEPYQRVSRFWTVGFEQVGVVAKSSGSHRIEIEPARPLDRPAEYSVAVERLMSVEAQEAFRRRLRADARIAWIERNSIEMRSIDIDADDFSDLAPLREVFGDARVVMLGEQSHGDGSSNVARSRLIRYLHEELGFDVLAFEAGLYDMNRIWRAALAGRSPDPLWGGSETAPLSRYLTERLEGDRPLELMGVDPQFLPGTDRAEAFFREISDHAERTGLDAGPLADPGFREVLGAFLDGRHYLDLPPTGERELLLRSLDSVAEAFRRAPLPSASEVADERLFWIRVLETAASEAESLYRAREAGDLGIHGANRDREMARNLVWIARVLRPDSRIIVWAHGFHTMRNPHRVLSTRQLDFSDAVTMGHVASEELGDALYSLGATSYEGAHGRACRPPIEIVRDQVDEVELEELLEAAGLRHAIVDLRGAGTEAGGLANLIFARPVDHVAELAPWAEIYDGFLFLRSMRPTSCDEDE